jgi:DNA polymerase III epsilon subunit-like protein
MSDDKEFRIPFDVSRRGRRPETEEKALIRRAIGRAIDRPAIGSNRRNRNRGFNIDLPTGGKPGSRRPTGTNRDIDGDGWVDEGTTNPRWVGLPDANNDGNQLSSGGRFDKLESITEPSTKLSSGEKPPRVPRKISYGPFIGNAESLADGVNSWDEFAERYRGRDVVWLDYETTGLVFDEFGADSSNGSPLQVGAVKVRDGKIVGKINIYMNPGMKMSEWEKWSRDNLKDMDGNPYTDEFFDDKPSIAETHRMLAEFAGPDAILGVQNAVFDKSVLDKALDESEIDWRPSGYIDTRDISAMTLPRWTPETDDGPVMLDDNGNVVLDKDGKKIPSSSLKSITEYLGVELGDKHHTADADAEAAAMVMEKILDNAAKKGWSTEALDRPRREAFLKKRKEKFDSQMAEFEEQKKDYLARVKLAEARSSDETLSSGKRPTITFGKPEPKEDTKPIRPTIYMGNVPVKYGSKHPVTGKPIRRNSSTWLQGLSSKQMSELLVPDSFDDFIESLIDDFINDADNAPPAFVQGVRAEFKKLSELPHVKADYSPESVKAIRNALETALESTPGMKWAFERFGAPSFMMWPEDSYSAYLDLLEKFGDAEGIRKMRNQKPGTIVVSGATSGNLSLVLLNKDVILRGVRPAGMAGRVEPVHSKTSSAISKNDPVIDSSIAGLMLHEYGHWIHMKAKLETERGTRAKSMTPYGAGHMSRPQVSRAAVIAEQYYDESFGKMLHSLNESGQPWDRTPNMPRTATLYAHRNGKEMIAEGIAAVLHPDKTFMERFINQRLRDDVLALLGVDGANIPWGDGTLSSGKTPTSQVGKFNFADDPSWASVDQVVKPEIIDSTIRDPKDPDAIPDVLQSTIEDWGDWDPCRDMRKFAYELSGASRSDGDPNIDRSYAEENPNARRMKASDEQRKEQAKLLMALLAERTSATAAYDRETLYRSVQLSPTDSAQFWEAMKVGNQVDMPLLAFADRRSMGTNEYLSKFGNDVLIELTDTPGSVPAGLFPPYYSDGDEDYLLQGLEEGIYYELESMDANPDSENSDYREMLEQLTDLIERYDQVRKKGNLEREKLREEIEELANELGFGREFTWSGNQMNEDSPGYYDALEDFSSYSENAPREHISGGRFEVIEIKDDPMGTYKKIVVIRQIGAFDPQKSGTIIRKRTLREAEEALKKRES